MYWMGDDKYYFYCTVSAFGSSNDVYIKGTSNNTDCLGNRKLYVMFVPTDVLVDKKVVLCVPNEGCAYLVRGHGYASEEVTEFIKFCKGSYNTMDAWLKRDFHVYSEVVASPINLYEHIDLNDEQVYKDRKKSIVVAIGLVGVVTAAGIVTLCRKLSK